MSESIRLIRRNGASGYNRLVFQTHNLGGTDYDHIAYLSDDDAAALSAGGIGQIFDAPALPDAKPESLWISVGEARGDGQRPWVLSVGESMVGLVSDDVVLRLIMQKAVSFRDPAEPDWERRDLERLRVKLDEALTLADQLRVSIGRLEQKRSAIGDLALGEPEL